MEKISLLKTSVLCPIIHQNYLILLAALGIRPLNFTVDYWLSNLELLFPFVDYLIGPIAVMVLFMEGGCKRAPMFCKFEVFMPVVLRIFGNTCGRCTYSPFSFSQ